MRATESLEQEHGRILKAVAVLQAMAQLVEQGEELEPSAVSKVFRYLDQFADQYHHSKEEKTLFPLLVERGIQGRGGLIGAMLMEHEQVRRMGEEIKEQATILNGSERVRRVFVDEVRTYTRLFRRHIDKENQILFHLAEEVLTDQDRDLLSKELSNNSDVDYSVLAELELLLDELVRTYLD